MLPASYAKMPIVDISSGSVIGFEILLRRYCKLKLHHFIQQPELFIIHHNRLIDSLKQLDESGKIREQGQKLFLNMLPDQFISEQALYALNTLHQEPDYLLVIEMTEANFTGAHRKLVQNLGKLRQSGCELAIDDFGAAESNFHRVLELAPRYIKLDQPFIQDTKGGREKINNLKQLISFFHQLGKEVIVEGVESQKHFEISHLVEADYAQGYYFGQPEPI